MLERLKKLVGSDRLYIKAHDNPDVDSIISGALLEDLLRDAGIAAIFRVPDKSLDRESCAIVAKYDIDIECYTGKIPVGSKVFLVDHHETNLECDVIGVIDHHPTEKEFNYPIYINEKSSSTTRIIFNLMLLECYNITAEKVELVLVGMVVDTCSMKSSKTADGDIELFEDMVEKYELDRQKLIDEGYCLTSLGKMEDICVNGVKHYTYGNYKVKSSYIQVKDIADVSHEILPIVKDCLMDRVKSERLDMWIFLVVAIDEGITIEVRVTENNIEEYTHTGIVSRGSTIMPRVEKDLLTIK